MNNSSEKNFIKHPLRLIGMVFIFLLTLSFIPTETEIFGIQLKPVDVISDFSAENESENYYDDENTDTETKEEPQVNEAGFYFTPAITQLGSWTDKEFDKLTSASSFSLQTKQVKISGNIQQMQHFFNALKKSKSQKVRIAHYGDSAIEGDNISCELRDKLQKKFGGKGLGFLAITSQDISFRQTVTHSFSDTWENSSIFTSNPKKLPVGINGEIFIPKPKSWIQYVTRNSYRRVKNFNKVNLYYTNAKPGKISYSFDKKRKKTAQLKTGSNIKELQLKTPRKAKQVKIEFPEKNMGFFYGVSLENGNGVYVDNFPLRGNSGVNLYDIKSSTLKEFSKFLDYKLVVLYFGLNIAGNNKKANYTWYEKKMTKVITKFKKAFPQCSFLVVSVSDKSIKKGRRFVTNPSIPKLVKAQQNIAKKTNVAFWNLFEAMGGKNAMSKWVKASPKLASSDYTHFTLAGSKKVAAMLAKALINCYEQNK